MTPQEQAEPDFDISPEEGGQPVEFVDAPDDDCTHGPEHRCWSCVGDDDFMPYQEVPR